MSVNVQVLMKYHGYECVSLKLNVNESDLVKEYYGRENDLVKECDVHENVDVDGKKRTILQYPERPATW